MPGQLLMLGPFSGGYANASSLGEVQENQLTELINMNVSQDQSLVSRGPIVPESGTNVSQSGKSWVLYGVYRRDDTSWYAMAAKPTDSGYDIVAVLKGNFDSAAAYFTIKSLASDTPPSDAVQYEDYMYFLAPTGTSYTAFKWNPLLGVTDLSIPRGSSITSLKSRLFITGTRSATTGSRMYFSKIEGATIDPDTFPSTNFVDVGYGIGGLTTAVAQVSSSLYIFKDSATYRFTYSSDIKQGTVDIVSGAIGAPNARCLASYENALYVYFAGVVYELFNGNFTSISRDIEFHADEEGYVTGADGASLSVVGDYLVVRVHNALYAYSLITRQWSRWRSQHGVPNEFFSMPGTAFTNDATYVSATLPGTTAASANEYSSNQDSSYLSSPTQQVSVGEEFGGFPGELQVTLSPVGGAYSGSLCLNNGLGKDLSIDTFNATAVPLSTLTLSVRLTGTGWFTGSTNPTGFTIQMAVSFLSIDGSVTTTTINPTASTKVSDDAKDFTWTVNTPERALSYQVRLIVGLTSTEVAPSFKLSGISILRTGGTIGSGIIRYSPYYSSGSVLGERIDVDVITSVFDYGNPAIFKRLFWWGADLRTNRALTGSVIPLGYNNKVTWGDIDGRPYVDLSYGTWGSPLSAVQVDVSYAVEDFSQAPTMISENGRYFIKFPKSLRFRQIKYRIKTSAFGTKQTGPVQFFRLATVASNKAVLTQKVNA